MRKSCMGNKRVESREQRRRWQVGCGVMGVSGRVAQVPSMHRQSVALGSLAFEKDWWHLGGHWGHWGQVA
jgi:hypothetical protein